MEETRFVNRGQQPRHLTSVLFLHDFIQPTTFELAPTQARQPLRVFISYAQVFLLFLLG